MSPAAPALRLAELLGALSLATDLSNGQPHEHGLRCTLLALRLAQDEPMPVRQTVYWTGLLHYLGCVGFAVEEASLAVGDDIALRRSFEQADLSGARAVLGLVLRDIGRGHPWPARAAALARFVASPEAPRQHAVAVCDAALHFARKLQMPDAVAQALAATDERYDGSGLPQRLAGDEIPLAQRYFEVARVGAGFTARTGVASAIAEVTRRAGLVHDLGRVAVPSGLWDKPGPLNAAEWERVHLHSYTTDRVLRRSPSLRPYADIAGHCHERLDGSGYHRGEGTIERPVRLLAAADAYAACVAKRAHRPALGADGARRALLDDAAQGRLCPRAVDAVLQAAGQAPRRARDERLSAREIEVLALLVRGGSNKQIGRQLGISPRTVQHHTIRIYGKTGVHSRAGVALWAVENGLL